MEGSDLGLVEQARAGDADAFRELVERYGRPLFRTAVRITGNEAQAEDVVQEAFLRAYRKLRGFDGRSQFWSWLYRITVNCALDLMRRESRRPQPQPIVGSAPVDALEAADPDPERIAASGEIGRRVRQVLDTMSPKERTAFVLRHYEGRSISEIGEILGTRENATKQAVFRAVKKLRTALAPVVAGGGRENHEAAY